VRRVNEETAQTNAQAAAIALAALKDLTSGQGNVSELNTKASTLKTVTVSSVLKLSNLIDKDEEFTVDIYEGLMEDLEEEMQKIPHLKRVKVVREGEEKLGAEVGCAFIEFKDKKSAEIAMKSLKGRVYDGREI
jgi:RNA recognition motif-containing protein